MELKPGWLARQSHQNAIEVATWPAWMRRGLPVDELTEEQRAAAVKILRDRLDELDPNWKSGEVGGDLIWR